MVESVENILPEREGLLELFSGFIRAQNSPLIKGIDGLSGFFGDNILSSNVK